MQSIHTMARNTLSNGKYKNRYLLTSKYLKNAANLLFVFAAVVSFLFLYNSSANGMNCVEVFHQQLRSKSCYPKLGLRPLKTRDEIPFMLEEQKFKTGIEIGVREGEFAKQTLDVWKSCEKYHLVDLWEYQENYKDASNVNNAGHAKNLLTAKDNMKDYQEKVEFHKMLSTQAAKLFEKESIDYLYIDARHDYCGVLEDIKNFWSILKPGGIMAGHDYNENNEIRGQDWGLCGDGTRNEMAVKGAVNDFFLSKGLTISVTYYREQNFMSWLVQKPLC